MEFRNIFCIGRNYVDHAVELGNDVPDQPMVFSKPLNSLVYADGKEIHYPGNRGEIHHELEVVLYIGKDMTDEDFWVDEIVSKMALGIDLTLRDVQSELKKKGHPWLLAKGFKNAAIVTEFWDFPGEAVCRERDFCLLRDGKTVQKGNITSMIFSFRTILAYIQANFGLKKGDIIFTGTPEGVGPISNGEKYELRWGEESKGGFGIRMNE
ncbi:fumarylacetoacetate hydrolase family protein [Lederbergia sp. NSJ-179]|uniref:fumarylacetoacetate hydrolase family protein n=1 Tax=Lederbergia sp. NSJ-179 TaxID=2931402 RepID=UPI001FD0A9A9|nr:fumarylacetoacetate hydrolase family protein [Lederbergia sp. NSJ-179]MCJ7842898.1 fumarylacetoacetate hydrolase family protein [Lederbergia sp. NSJ-179]